MDEDLDSQSWEIRETFAYYGRAVYASSVVEVALAHVLLYAQFMKKVRDDYVATKGKGFDRKQYERDFDAFMDDQFAQTMGNLMRRVEKFGGFDDALKARIADAKKRRDFLTHHYWRERSVDFATSAGRERMREELNADAEMFERLDRDIDAAGPSCGRRPIRGEASRAAWRRIRGHRRSTDGAEEEWGGVRRDGLRAGGESSGARHGDCSHEYAGSWCPPRSQRRLQSRCQSRRARRSGILGVVFPSGG